jgi:hypothetical protein
MPGLAVGNRNGNGLKFKASDSNYILAPHSEILNFDYNNPCTIVGLGIIYDSVSFSGIFNKTTVNGSNGYVVNIVRTSATDFQLAGLFCRNLAYKRALASGFKFGEMVHFAWVNPGDGIPANYHIYKNSAPLTVSATHDTSGSCKSTAAINIGKFQNSIGVDCFLDSILYSVKVFNLALTQKNITELYKSDNFRCSAMSNLVAGYEFDDKAGTIAKDSLANNGTLTNFTNTSLGVNNQWLDNNQQPILI